MSDTSGKLLITYRCISNGKESWGYAINHNINEFIEDVEQHKDGPYLIVNTVQITDEQAARWDGVIKGF